MTGRNVAPIPRLINRRRRSPRPALKFFPHPTLKRFHILRTAKKILHQVVRGHRSPRLQHDASITHRGIASQQIRMIELLEEIFRNYRIPHVSVISGRVTAQMAERRVHVDAGRWSKERVAFRVCE
jgi:hypothetical protein